MLLTIHIIAGGLAIVLGAIALSVRKGGSAHRRSGMLFIYAMVIMGVTASVLALFHGTAATNVTAAILSIYFVGTALTTVRPPSRWTRVIDIGALLIALGLVILATLGGWKAVNTAGVSSGGVPFRTVGVMSFVLAFFLMLAAAGDVRILRQGMPRGGRRLARHLWRMCFALFIAAGSFFSIRARVATILPEPFTTAPMRMLPIVLIFGAMFYWLWRLRVRRPAPVTVRHEPAPPAASAK